MPKIAKALSALEVRRLGVGTHSVGHVPGLRLQVTSTSSSWILRVVVGGQRREIGLGGYPAVSLAKAVEEAKTDRSVVRQGSDPAELRRAARQALKRSQVQTFQVAAKRCIKAISPGWTNKKHAAQWTNTLETYAMPILAELAVQSITPSHIHEVLEPIWIDKPETANRVRNRIERVIEFARGLGWVSGANPAALKALKSLLPSRSKNQAVIPHPSMPIAALSPFYANLSQHPDIAARCLQWLILTACRSSEARFASWGEIDPANRVWTIPSVRMKAGKAHRVPLTNEMLELLDRLPKDSKLLFPARFGLDEAIGAHRMQAVMRQLGELVAVPHGFRSTFSTWANSSSSYPADVIEMALAHAIENKVRATYQRSDLLEKRVALMAEWNQLVATAVRV